MKLDFKALRILQAQVLVAALVLTGFLLVGCGELSEEGKQFLATAAFSSAERATAFTPWVDILVARDQADAQQAGEFLVSHAKALALDADTLSRFSKMVELGGYKKDVIVEVLTKLSENAEGMLQEWTLATPKLKANEKMAGTWGAYAQAHRNALVAIAANYRMFLVREKPKQKE